MKGLLLVAPSSTLRCCCSYRNRKVFSSISHFSYYNPLNNNKYVTHRDCRQLSVNLVNQQYSFSSSNFAIKRPRFFSGPSMASPVQNVSAVGDDDASSAAAGQMDVFRLIQAHQENVARLPPVEEIKTVLHHSLRGMLSTFSHKHKGYPSGSMVDFACDTYGSPILAVSSLAFHTKDLCPLQMELEESSLTILLALCYNGLHQNASYHIPVLLLLMKLLKFNTSNDVMYLGSHRKQPLCSSTKNYKAKDPEDRTELVITVHGDALPVAESDKDAIRTAYLARHPNAFWVDFGDFHFLRIDPKVVRYVSGVATAALGAGEFSKEEFAAAKIDPIYQFSKPIGSHMKKDHAEDTKLIVQHSTSVPVDFAYILDVDSLGINVKAGFQGNTLKLRIPFPRRAADRKDVKTLIVEMLQAERDQGN